MVFTLVCIFVSVGSLFFFGVPIARLLAEPGDDVETWIVRAPFVGLAVIVLTLQNLVYLDWRIGITAPWLWMAGLGIWLWTARTSNLALIFSHIPRFLLAVALGVYLIQGLGLLIAGARYYAGSAFIDQYNYTVTAQYLADQPFSLSYDQVDNRPYLFKAIGAKYDRIGQSVLHAFFATSINADARSTFEVAILLSPLLITLVVYLLARELGMSQALAGFAGGMAGVLPGVTSVHLESFLSQALGMPFLLLWPLFIQRAIERPNWKRILAASLVLATGTSLYTEFFAIFLAVGAWLVGVALLTERAKKFSSLLYCVLIVGVSLLLNPGFIQGVANVLGRVSVPGLLIGFYPWAFSAEGLERIWLGDAVQMIPSTWRTLSAIVAFDLIQIAYLGLAVLTWKQRRGLACALLVMAGLPLFIIGLGSSYEYQFYKLLLTVSPLFSLGVVWAVHEMNQFLPRFFRVVTWIGLGVCLFICVVATGMMTGAAAFGVGRNEWARTLTSPATRQVQDVLSNMTGRDISIVWDEGPFFGAYQNGWLSYFARNNRIWLSNPRLSDINLADYPSAAPILDWARVPDNHLLLASSKWERYLYNPSGNLVWQNDVYSIWQINGGSWVVIDEIGNPNGLEQSQGQTFFWIGGEETKLTIHAGKAGVVTLAGDAMAGPSLPSTSSRSIMIQRAPKFEEQKQVILDYQQPVRLSLTVPITAGLNQISLRSLDTPTLSVLPNGDMRSLLIGVSSLQIVGFEPAAAVE